MGFGFGSNFGSTSSFGDVEGGLGTNGFEVSLNYITGVPDANILPSNDLQLCFKGFQKRDNTTREKSIANLLKLIELDPKQIDKDLVIISWCQVYAKLSIDESKRVRAVTHEIQSKFVSTLGKKYAKYLKDTIGIWVAGLFDSDRSVCRACKTSILRAFGNDTTKTSNLWKIYFHQIVNYCYQVFAIETMNTLSDERFADKDEIKTKYQRVTLGAVLLFVQALNKLKEDDIGLKEKTKDLMSKILENKRFQDLFSNKDTHIKKAMYQLTRVLLTNEQVICLLDDQFFSKFASAALFGLKINKHINPIVYSGAVISMLDALVVLTRHDSSFWTTTKNADAYLLGILRLGSLNSDPVYYEVLSILLDILPQSYLDSFEKLNIYLTVLENDLDREKISAFQERAWKCYLKLVRSFLSRLEEDNSDTVITSVTSHVIQYLDTPRSLSKSFVIEFSTLKEFSSGSIDVLSDINSGIMNSLPCRRIEFQDFKVPSIVHETQFLDNFVTVLAANKSDLLEVLLANSIDALKDETEEHPTLSLSIIDIYIKKNFTSYRSAVDELIPSLDKYLSLDYIDQPLRVLVDYSNSKFCNTSILASLVNSIFIKLHKLNQESSLLKDISHIKGFEVKQAPDIRKYLLERSQNEAVNTHASEDSTLFKFLTPKILINMFNNADTSEKFHLFVSGCLLHYQEDPLIEFASETPKFIESLYQYLDDEDASELLSKLETRLTDKTFKSACFKALLSTIESRTITPELLIHVKDFDMKTWVDFLPGEILSEIEAVLPSQPDNRLVISNPFGTGIYWFTDGKGERLDNESIPQLIRKALFYTTVLKDYPKLVDDKPTLVVELAVLGQIALDYILLKDSPSEAIQTASSSLENDSLDMLKSLFKECTLKDVLTTKELPFKAAKYLFQMLNNENQCCKYYFYRVYQRIVQSFNESTDYIPELAGSPVKISILLNYDKKLLVSKDLFRLRNGTAASLVGLRSSEDIIRKGLPSIVLLNKLIDLDVDYEIPEDLELFPPQRFMMVLSSINNWPDCETAYDPEFISVRVALMEFVQNYVNGIYHICDTDYPSSIIDKVFDLGLRLLTESISVINSGNGTMELTYCTLKTYLLLNNYSDQIEEWEDNVEDIEKELVDLLFKRLQMPGSSRADHLVNGLLPNIFFKLIPAKMIVSQYDKFYGVLMDTPSIDTERIIVSLLAQLIPIVQDGLVVESTLDKAKLESAKIPEQLLQIVRNEHECSEQKYLWSWLLILCHFNKITHQLRESYISQLGEELISEFLTYLVTGIDVIRFKVPVDMDTTYSYNYSVIDAGSVEVEDEMKKLLVNLLFMTMKYIGGSTIQKWYNSIRDKQLKTSTDGFITKYISGTLIDDILETLSSKEKIEDETFKIKVNRATNEIKCACDIDDQTMEISIILPADYPLSQIAVKGISRVGVDEKKWKSWLLSCRYVINFQNVSILDAVKHFRENVQANFENYDDCAICYSIINIIDHSTPNKMVQELRCIYMSSLQK
ncbi:hypothetical protein FOA43_003283 [Brettanomyces nanus]|uniref:E3 ubiquitin-protein ligase listerin n=1 Tax=Eeniella nana TaxID=13502 RepID=A0A875RVY4_EENNA|nr:uncharacterized protein FOA43_003283 [Brettanomyces nanus]QPG75897.1 hypothetical protein FOA43_003283 [Brettanomyces nanus]